jgi:TRAP-type C4-dicarboxylate transport system permease small subunit
MLGISYLSPKTDLILIIFSSILFIFAGVGGLLGYSDFQISEKIEYSYKIFNNETVISFENKIPIYTENKLFNYTIPFFSILLGIYVLFISIENGKGRKTKTSGA